MHLHFSELCIKCQDIVILIVIYIMGGQTVNMKSKTDNYEIFYSFGPTLWSHP